MKVKREPKEPVVFSLIVKVRNSFQSRFFTDAT